MNLFDAHCHLQDARLAEDRAGVLSQARAVGVIELRLKERRRSIGQRWSY